VNYDSAGKTSKDLLSLKRMIRRKPIIRAVVAYPQQRVAMETFGQPVVCCGNDTESSASAHHGPAQRDAQNPRIARQPQFRGRCGTGDDAHARSCRRQREDVSGPDASSGVRPASVDQQKLEDGPPQPRHRVTELQVGYRLAGPQAQG